MQKKSQESIPHIPSLIKIESHAKIFLRIAVSNKGSMWPLCKKFGAEGNGVNEIKVRLEFRKVQG